jgi:hypothetical protein
VGGTTTVDGKRAYRLVSGKVLVDRTERRPALDRHPGASCYERARADGEEPRLPEPVCEETP